MPTKVFVCYVNLKIHFLSSDLYTHEISNLFFIFPEFSKLFLFDIFFFLNII